MVSSFHVDLRAQKLVVIAPPHNLLDGDTALNPAASVASEALVANAQTLLDQVKMDLNLTQGEVTMFIPDMPNVPPQNVPVMIAQANQAKPSDVTTTRTLGVCSPAPNDNYSLENVVGPVGEAGLYLRTYEHQQVQNIGTVTVLQQPKHGVLRLVTEADRGTLFSSTSGPADPSNPGYAYLPEQGYLGKDKAVMLVEIAGVKVKVVYYFQAVEGPLGNYGTQDNCSKTGVFWKISANLDANGTSTITTVDYQAAPIDTSALASILGSSILSGTAGITLTIADLPNGALGQTTGKSITLDDNAAGNNWFIDTTPADNSEFLPTSNPYEWVAKEGSAAYGKMDMLSVLLHEYGHALGIEHSADAHDYMGTTLTAGVRRLPSADELALMQQLVSGVKTEMAVSTQDSSNNAPSQLPLLPLGGFGLAFLGRLRSSRYGSTNIEADLSTLVVNYDAFANAQLNNGLFTSVNGMPPDNGWNKQGQVDFVNGTATLQEVTTSQTRLNQVFMVKPTDRYLSFTLSGSALENMNGAPDDAFEVALLDANTGASLLGSDGLSRSDAFLNLQADGTERLSTGVTSTLNPDGSRTYRVDLAGIAAGTAVNLSFDLIGFGKASSHVTVSNVRVGDTLPVLHDDAPTIAEDSTLAFDPFAQVDNASTLVLGSQVVDVPAHGTVTVNTDGTFVYTPAHDYFGADSFTYTINDGANVSNLATVSVTVTAVNDAPVAADVYATATATEDTPLNIALGNFASDVDSATLTTQIVTGPTHGVLVANPDGNYTYTAEANYFGLDSFTWMANDGELDSNLATVNLSVMPVNDAPVTADASATTAEDTACVFQLVDFGFSAP